MGKIRKKYCRYEMKCRWRGVKNCCSWTGYCTTETYHPIQKTTDNKKTK
jgi:hypothetical protein